jgi:hypothetical protein
MYTKQKLIRVMKFTLFNIEIKLGLQKTNILVKFD